MHHLILTMNLVGGGRGTKAGYALDVGVTSSSQDIASSSGYFRHIAQPYDAVSLVLSLSMCILIVSEVMFIYICLHHVKKSASAVAGHSAESFQK